MDNSSSGPFIEQCKEDFTAAFDRALLANQRLNIIFGALLSIELVLLAIFFSLLVKNALISLMLGGVVFTVFGFYMVKQYLSFKKSLLLQEKIASLTHKVREQAPHVPGTLPYYLDLSKIFCSLSDTLKNKELCYFQFPSFLSFLNPYIKQLSLWSHTGDVFSAREMLLLAAVGEHLAYVRAEPTQADAHTLLAHVYVLLSGLYAPLRKKDAHYKMKFRETLLKAIEEFKILREFQPHDPWVHLQLAYSYRDLEEIEEEKAIYEILTNLLPSDLDIKFRLGSLYFIRGENGKGLKIYDELKKASFPQAESLMLNYGKNG